MWFNDGAKSRNEATVLIRSEIKLRRTFSGEPCGVLNCKIRMYLSSSLCKVVVDVKGCVWYVKHHVTKHA